MATKHYIFKGITKWAKVHKPDEEYQNYQVPLYMDEKSWADYEESGIRLMTKKDKETGEPFVTFKRKHAEFNNFKKKNQINGPPKVLILKDDGTYAPLGEDVLIGNGSVVSVKVEVYDTPRTGGKGHRLLAVGVEKLVEYKPNAAPESNVPVMPF